MLNQVRTLACLAVNKILVRIIQSIIILNILYNSNAEVSSYIDFSYSSSGLWNSIGRPSACWINSLQRRYYGSDFLSFSYWRRRDLALQACSIRHGGQKLIW